MKALNLFEKYNNLENKINEWKNKNSDSLISENKKYDLKVGDFISFYGGYNDNILFTSKIFAVDKKDDEVYVYWDCFWFPVKLNDPKRIVTKI